MKNRQSQEDIEDKLDLFSKKVYGGPKGHLFHLYLNGEIGDAEDYNGWLSLLETASPDDIIIMHINSPGGYLDTALQLSNSMRKTEAEVIIQVEGSCMSAATLILLSGDAIEIAPHSRFMFHTYSSGIYSKASDLYTWFDAQKAWFDEIVDDYYSDFLTEEEIQKLKDGTDLYFTAKEISDKLQIKISAMIETVTNIEKEKEKSESSEIDCLKKQLADKDAELKSMKKLIPKESTTKKSSKN